MKTATDEPSKLLKRSEVEALTGLSRSTIYAAMRRENFPVPLRLTGKAVRWREAEILAWIESRPRATGEGITATYSGREAH